MKNIIKRLINIFSILSIFPLISFFYTIYKRILINNAAVVDAENKNPKNPFNKFDVPYESIYDFDAIIYFLLVIVLTVIFNYVFFGKFTLWNSKDENK